MFFSVEGHCLSSPQRKDGVSRGGENQRTVEEIRGLCRFWAGTCGVEKRFDDAVDLRLG